jgi:hypothetical protein
MYAIGLMYQNKPGSFGPWPSGCCGDAADGYPQMGYSLSGAKIPDLFIFA